MNTARYARDVISDRVSLYSTASSVLLADVKCLGKQYPLHKPITPTSPLNNTSSVMECTPLETDGRGGIVATDGRRVTLKGINVDGSMKLPASPPMPSYSGNPCEYDNIFFEGDTVSFVGRPFPLEDVYEHFSRIKSWGYNTIRYLLTWEALEHAGPGIYDDDFVEHTIRTLEIIGNIGGLYVFLEIHQDVWSRFCGGSGAPMWTLYCAGFEPRRFAATEASVLHNDPRFHGGRKRSTSTKRRESNKASERNKTTKRTENKAGENKAGEKENDNERREKTSNESDSDAKSQSEQSQEDQSPDEKSQEKSESPNVAPTDEPYPKMLWVTNYNRLAAMTMFTLFFLGHDFFPHLKINGVNIQEYLQDRYFACIAHVWRAVTSRLRNLVENGTILGFESMNEPNMGLFGRSDVLVLPETQHLRVSTTPTALQAMKLGMGMACDVDEYKIMVTGPQKSGVRRVDPRGTRAWLSPSELNEVDLKYGWKREGWTGDCIYADAGVWLADTGEVVRRDYFAQGRYNTEYFINHNFVDFYLRFKSTVRDITPNLFVLMQPPVLEVPPKVKRDPRHVVDSKTIYCPHYYDGMSLMFKSWNTKFNVDTLGIMRNRYLNPVLGIVLGERAIRNCIRKQFLEIRRECEDNLGGIPCLMSETGMPFDMDDKRSYQSGRYPLQTGALDALAFALEGLDMSHTFWCYTSVNCHKWGDRWNNEDFSFWSPDDASEGSSGNSSRCSSRICSRRSSIKAIKAKVHRRSLSMLSRGGESSDRDDDVALTTSSQSVQSVHVKHDRKCLPSPDGVRAPSAVIRPYVVATLGKVVTAEFDMKSVKYSLSVRLDPRDQPRTADTPTVIFVPKWHFPFLNYGDVYLSAGYIRYNEQLEYLEWYHLEDVLEEQSEDVLPTAKAAVPRAPTPVPEPHTETIIIKNNSGSVDEVVKEGLFENCTVV